MLAIGVMTVSYVQYRFDQSDIKHAVNAVRYARPGGSTRPPLEDVLAQHFGVVPAAISWEPHIESKVKGTVQVRARLAQAPSDFIWEVDLVRFSVKPLSENAKLLTQSP